MLLLVIVLLLAMFGLAMIFRGLARAPTLSEPRCAKCGYDLRGFALTTPTRCSECGSDLTLRSAVRWGEYQRQPRWMIVGVVLLLLSGVSCVLLLKTRSRASMVPFARITSGPGWAAA